MIQTELIRVLLQFPKVIASLEVVAFVTKIRPKTTVARSEKIETRENAPLISVVP